MSRTRQEEPRQPAMAGAARPRERQPFALLPLLWLGFLAWPISDLIAGRDRGPAAVAAVLIAACVVPYVWLT